MLKIYCNLVNWLHDEQGQGLAEYALICAFIAIALIAALITVKGQLSNVYSNNASVLGSI